MLCFYYVDRPGLSTYLNSQRRGLAGRLAARRLWICLNAAPIPVRPPSSGSFAESILSLNHYIYENFKYMPGVTDVRGWRAGMAEPRLRPRPVGMTAGAVALKPRR